MYPWLAPSAKKFGTGRRAHWRIPVALQSSWMDRSTSNIHTASEKTETIASLSGILGPVKYTTDYATYHPSQSLGGGGGGGGGGSNGGWPWGSGFPWGDISKWIDDLARGIMTSVQQALNHVGIQINLNGTKILDSTNNTILRRLNSII